MDIVRICIDRVPEGTPAHTLCLDFQWRVVVAVQEDAGAMWFEPSDTPLPAKFVDLGSGYANDRPEALGAALACLEAGREAIAGTIETFQNVDDSNTEDTQEIRARTTAERRVDAKARAAATGRAA